MQKEIANYTSYKIKFDNKLFWINENVLYDFDNLRRIEYISDFSFDQDDLEITWIDGNGYNHSTYAYHYVKEPLKDSSVFGKKAILEAAQRTADSEKYMPIKIYIDSELKKLSDFAVEKSAPYKANLFADQHYCNVIMNTITEAKEALQDAQVELDKKRARYHL